MECTLRLRRLQAEYGLSDAGIAFVRAICGPRRDCVAPFSPAHEPAAAPAARAAASAAGGGRYTASTDTLRLVSTKYADREDNRREIMRILTGAARGWAAPRRRGEGAALRPAARGAELIQAAREEDKLGHPAPSSTAGSGPEELAASAAAPAAP